MHFMLLHWGENVNKNLLVKNSDLLIEIILLKKKTLSVNRLNIKLCEYQQKCPEMPFLQWDE